MMPPKYKKLTDFKIYEISAVDRPAQEPALARIIKGGDATLIYEPHPSERDPLSTPKPRLPQPAATAMKRDPEPLAFASFEKACQHLRDHGAGRVDALQKARRQYPELFDEYQVEAVSEQRPVAKAKPKPISDFESLVEDIADRRRVTKSVALKIARVEHPAVFEAYQAA
jgi:hypothetical protein